MNVHFKIYIKTPKEKDGVFVSENEFTNRKKLKTCLAL